MTTPNTNKEESIGPRALEIMGLGHLQGREVTTSTGSREKIDDFIDHCGPMVRGIIENIVEADPDNKDRQLAIDGLLTIVQGHIPEIREDVQTVLDSRQSY